MSDLFQNHAAKSGPVECLGQTFPSDEARREHYLKLLAEKLKDPAFRKIEGFPIASDEDILELSDPPYYTACPNPFVVDLVANWSSVDVDPSKYSVEPFAEDVSSGKNDPIYNVHAYATKVPPGAIEPIIRHYLGDNPGVVLDPFSGTGMTGVAVTRANRNAMVVLQDLSPAATHIAAQLVKEIDPASFKSSAQAILADVQRECGWMYTTEKHGVPAEVRYYVWSDVYSCSSCTQPVRIWDIEGTKSVGGLKEKVACPHCGSLTSKQQMSAVTERYYDHVLGAVNERIRSEPVLKVTVKSNRSTKIDVDANDLDIVRRIEDQEIPYPVPSSKMLFKDGCWGDQWRSSYHLGVTHTHHFYTKRNLWILCAIWDRIEKTNNHAMRRLLQFWFSASLSRATRLNRYMAQHDRHVGPLAGTLFIGPIQAEISPFYFFNDKIDDVSGALSPNGAGLKGRSVVSTGSSGTLPLAEESVDLIFTDPPFGDNLMYSELNFLAEAWQRVHTNQTPEAVIAKTQNKSLREFEGLMKRVFAECYRVLKAGRWMVVEFHNSRNSVWVAIQEALNLAGFVIADVRTLDKQKGTTKQMTQAGTVKQDLIITAYKPTSSLESNFELKAGTEEGVWEFVKAHLAQLPVFVAKGGEAEVIAERQGFLLFDRMVAFHIQRGFTVPMSAGDFYSGLAHRFVERDGMFFLQEQAVAYDRKRATVREVLQLQLFVVDESSAIQWLKQQLLKKPQTFQELQPQFLKEIGGWQKHEKPLELSDLLEQSFLRYDGAGEVPSQIHAYLSSNFKELRNLPKSSDELRARAKDRWFVPDPSKAQELDKFREKRLLREFEIYKSHVGRRLREFRVEAMRAGFKHAWGERDYATIISVARKIPEEILQEDEKLLLLYDQALTRAEAGA
jgi:DNA modification methylase/DNA-directed RNA polymerase subunit RPC12/RpoP